MARRQRLTNNSDETDLASLLAGDTVFAIPYFQRPYKWKPERLNQLNEDLLNLIDEDGFHFLGAVIIHGRRSNPSEPDVFEVIDGQQRITTVFLYICAIIRTLCEHGEYGEAAGLFQKYVAITRNTGLPSNSKLHSCKDDRAQLNAVILDLLSDQAFADHLSSFTYRPLSATGAATGRLSKNYRLAKRFFSRQAEAEGIERVKDLYRVLLEAMSVVQIDVWDPTNGPKIFDSLNSRQEPMTTGDLVRNEIFMRLAGEQPDEIEQLDANVWQPFYVKFRQGDRDLFDSYFFPFGLIQDPNIRKSEVYAKLRDRWRVHLDPAEIIAELAIYQNAFLDAVCGTNLQGFGLTGKSAFERFSLMDPPSSTLPFVMRLSQAVKDEELSEGVAAAVLGVVESFLLRRAVCGHEPTGLHAVFKRLWSDCGGNVNVGAVEAAIRKHKTVAWPSDEDFSNAIQSRPLYGVSVAKYFLLQWNKSLGGDPPPDECWIEHILPQTTTESWQQLFTTEEHSRMKDLAANLLPLSRQMNQGLGNAAYPVKRTVYQNDSGFKGTRQFSAEHAEWTPIELKARSDQLASWAVRRWAT